MCLRPRSLGSVPFQRSPSPSSSRTLFSFSRIFRQVPEVAPGASIGPQILRRIGRCDLVCGCRQRFAFSSVLPLPAHRTLRSIVHKQPFRGLLFAVTESVISGATRGRLGFTFRKAVMLWLSAETPPPAHALSGLPIRCLRLPVGHSAPPVGVPTPHYVR